MAAHLDTVCRYKGQDISVIVDNGNTLWFKGNDIVTKSQYARPARAVHDHVHPEDKQSYMNLQVLYGFHLKGVHKYTTFINELGVYSLISSLQTPAARAFKQWMVHELLPTLRDDMRQRLQLEIDQLRLEDAQLRLDDAQLRLEDVQLKQENDQLKLDVAQLKLEIAQVRLDNTQLKQTDKKLRHRLAQIQPDVVIKTTDTSRLHQFVLLRLSNANPSLYYAIRAQKCNMRDRLLEVKMTHPLCYRIYQIPYIPNSINFYNRMKEQLQIDANGNEFTSHYDSEAELIAAIEALKNSLCEAD